MLSKSIFSKVSLRTRLRALVIRGLLLVGILATLLVFVSRAVKDGGHFQVVPETVWRDTSVAALAFVALREVFRGRRYDRGFLALTTFFVLVVVVTLRGVLFG